MNPRELTGQDYYKSRDVPTASNQLTMTDHPLQTDFSIQAILDDAPPPSAESSSDRVNTMTPPRLSVKHEPKPSPPSASATNADVDAAVWSSSVRRHSLESLSELISDISWEEIDSGVGGDEESSLEAAAQMRLRFDAAAANLSVEETLGVAGAVNDQFHHSQVQSDLTALAAAGLYYPESSSVARTHHQGLADYSSKSTFEPAAAATGLDYSAAASRTNTPQQPAAAFPDWTQKQFRGGGRRPYGRSVVAALSWWFRHLPYLSTKEMLTLGALTGLSRHQIKIWWQNRRHSQRAATSGRGGAADNCSLLSDSLPWCLLPGGGTIPSPHSAQRDRMFSYMLQFFYTYVLPRITYSHSVAILDL